MPSAVPEQDRHRASGEVGDSEIGLAIAVEVSYGYGARLRACDWSRGRLERTITVSQKDGDCIAGEVSHREVEMAVVVEVRRRHGVRAAAGCERPLRAKKARCGAQSRTPTLLSSSSATATSRTSVTTEVLPSPLAGDLASVEKSARLNRYCCA